MQPTSRRGISKSNKRSTSTLGQDIYVVGLTNIGGKLVKDYWIEQTQHVFKFMLLGGECVIKCKTCYLSAYFFHTE